jgi:hypothetical protein
MHLQISIHFINALMIVLKVLTPGQSMLQAMQYVYPFYMRFAPVYYWDDDSSS